jgi:hypothetical protein
MTTASQLVGRQFIWMATLHQKFVQRGLCIVLLAVVAILIPSCRSRSSASPNYHSIRDAEDWQNPFIVVEADGVDIVLPDDRAHVSMDKLRDYLSQLPGRYWPYGKIIAISEAGFRSGNDDERIRQNKALTKQIVESMGIRIDWWPSAALPPNINRCTRAATACFA